MRNNTDRKFTARPILPKFNHYTVCSPDRYNTRVTMLAYGQLMRYKQAYVTYSTVTKCTQIVCHNLKQCPSLPPALTTQLNLAYLYMQHIRALR